VSIDNPDTCPLCNNGIDPVFIYGYCSTKKIGQDDCLQVIYRCTKEKCQGLFVSYYRTLDPNCDRFIYIKSRPINKKDREFTDTIESISPNFCLIYNQAHSAEQDGLTEICGVGYRKSLEFLIKDYLISREPGRTEEIKKKFLGKCISEEIKNDNIKTMAKRAVWLGNDETHYLKRWEGKDLNDLKKLIDATLYWIGMEKLAEDIPLEMPEGQK
jgi:hypothetical protein